MLFWINSFDVNNYYLYAKDKITKSQTNQLKTTQNNNDSKAISSTNNTNNTRTIAASKAYNQTPQPKIEAVAAKSLGIIIIGIITSSNSKKSVALIKNQKDKSVKAMKIGFKLLDRYPISKINQDSIQIVKEGSALLVYKGAFFTQDTNVAVKSKPKIGNEYTEKGFSRKTTDDLIDVNITGAYRDNVVKNQLQKILMEAATSPVLNNNSIIGFRISDITPGSIFEKAGFENQDVITKINETALNSPTSAIRVLQSVKQKTSVEVAIVRKGEQMNMTISVN